MKFFRPQVGSVTMAVIVSIYLLVLTNRTFFDKGLLYFSGHEVQFAGLVIAVFLLGVALLTSLSLKYLMKPAFILLVLVAGSASYFTDAFGTIFDRDMIQNVIVTTPGEAHNLLTPNLFVHLALYVGLPTALIMWTRIQHRPFLSKLLHNTAVVVPCLFGALAIVALNYPAFASTFRERGDLLMTLNPGGPIVGAVKYVRKLARERDIVVAPLGTDAKQGTRFASADLRSLTVIVVGETARAMNFSLNGYARNTNPELAKRSVLNFTNTSSCGTATAVSLPCMFSVYPRSDYSSAKALANENLVDVLTHAGIQVDWFDNNTGSKNVADRINYEFMPNSDDTRFCDDGECKDEILIERLKTYLQHRPKSGNAVVVLHQLGSHGPAYHKRYTAEFERFTPACQTAQFADCKQEEIVAAYDNTILYTDHILSEIIDLLKAEDPQTATAMIYMSDHGESLGENGLYLHGTPYFMAPKTQTSVPFITWLSDAYTKADGLNIDCLHAERDHAFSHDNLFHTVLGLTDVSTQVYDGALDAFAACRGSAGQIAGDIRKVDPS
ncbi:phosphoethanolamine transferase [Tianweitania sp. BSSL-BM11]|uniref:Phosphoethanolamine transferase n=1 Tax=Tianweitania aestuarii TaxID=2814886 RepID=A0ABS5RR93_9HYPH|nr:phosphoethanolamine--lipid A transferase [Tianweitania aestuarii]MBS9719573.1 phosphoethanolamine transferase [Tianweitania aestuarii]